MELVLDLFGDRGGGRLLFGGGFVGGRRRGRRFGGGEAEGREQARRGAEEDLHCWGLVRFEYNNKKLFYLNEIIRS